MLGGLGPAGPGFLAPYAVGLLSVLSDITGVGLYSKTLWNAGALYGKSRDGRAICSMERSSSSLEARRALGAT